MSQKVLVTLWESNVAPRFDMTTEVLIFLFREDGTVEDTRALVLAHPSKDELCNLILTEQINTVICGGIEQEIFEYLAWKKIRVIDSVIGPLERVMDRFKTNELTPGAILFDRPERKSHGKSI